MEVQYDYLECQLASDKRATLCFMSCTHAQLSACTSPYTSLHSIYLSSVIVLPFLYTCSASQLNDLIHLHDIWFETPLTTYCHMQVLPFPKPTNQPSNQLLWTRAIHRYKYTSVGIIIFQLKMFCTQTQTHTHTHSSLWHESV